MAAQRELNVALIGTGMMGRLHSLAYATLPSFFPEFPLIRRRVVVDVTEELAKRGSKQFGYDEWAVDWEHAIARDDIDIVSIVTPNDSHFPIAEVAMKHGKNILCEKPLACTAGEALTMAKMSTQSDGTHMVGFNYRRTPAILQAKKLIDEGAIGHILGFRALYLQDWAMPEGTPWSWRFGTRESGSGALGDIGSHAIDLAVFLVGEIESVAAAAETFVKSRPKSSASNFDAALKARKSRSDGERAPEMLPVDVDDVVTSIFRFKNGALGTLECSRFAFGHKNDLGFEVSGTKGAVAFRWERRNQLRFYSSADREDIQGFRTIVCGPPHPHGERLWAIPGLGTAFYEAQVLQVGDFVGAIIRGTRPETDFLYGYRIQAVMDSMLTAAKAGKWVGVQLDPVE